MHQIGTYSLLDNAPKWVGSWVHYPKENVKVIVAVLVLGRKQNFLVNHIVKDFFELDI